MSEDQNSRERLLSAAIDVIRVKGYAATRVDDIAAVAGVTKGSFFHHFPTKEACAREAAVFWSAQSEATFAGSRHRVPKRPAARVLAYIDFRISLLAGPVATYACYVGTVLQEVHDTHPELAADSAVSILGQAALLEGTWPPRLVPTTARRMTSRYILRRLSRVLCLLPRLKAVARVPRQASVICVAISNYDWRNKP